MVGVVLGWKTGALELVADGVAILGEPDDDGNAQCQELGKTLANA